MTLLLLLLAQQAAGPIAEPAEVVVVARRARCAVQLRGQELSKADLERHMREWARGIPVRVSAPDLASYRCLSRILFRLSDHGVQNVEFVDPAAPRTD